MRSFTKKLTLLSFAVGMALVGCKNDDDGTPQPNSSMTAIVDGASWSADQIACVMQNGYAYITGVAADGSTITLNLSGQNAGTYQLLQTSPNVGAYSIDTSTPAWATDQSNDVDAIVTVTDVNTTDSTISGEFKFIAYRSSDNSQVVITGGTFNEVSYKAINNEVADNFLIAKVDGVEFEATSLTSSINSGIIQFAGTASDGQRSLGFALDYDIAVGEHDLETLLGTNTAHYHSDADTELNTESGKINITVNNKATKLIQGSFHFEASDTQGTTSASITEGAFSLKY